MIVVFRSLEPHFAHWRVWHETNYIILVLLSQLAKVNWHRSICRSVSADISNLEGRKEIDGGRSPWRKEETLLPGIISWSILF